MCSLHDSGIYDVVYRSHRLYCGSPVDLWAVCQLLIAQTFIADSLSQVICTVDAMQSISLDNMSTADIWKLC